MQNYFGHATINKNVRRTFKQNEALSKEEKYICVYAYKQCEKKVKRMEETQKTVEKKNEKKNCTHRT